MGLELRSTAFGDGEMIPTVHTCDGADVSLPFAWVGVPDEAESLALILEDVDSVEGVWSHWVIYDMPVEVNVLDPAITPSKSLPMGGAQGRNDFGKIGYGGPCPSDGKTHRYVARLYALDAELRMEPGAERAELLQRMEGYVLEGCELMGRYRRPVDR